MVVRPDQYVANVLPLTATAELAAFFAPLLRAGTRVREFQNRAEWQRFFARFSVQAGGQRPAACPDLYSAAG